MKDASETPAGPFKVQLKSSPWKDKTTLISLLQML